MSKSLTPSQVVEALRPVTDPEIGQSIVDLDMVRDVKVDRKGRVTVQVALTIAGCPLRAEITNRVTAAVQPLPGVTEVTVDLTVMTDEEREALKAKLQGGGGHAGHSHGGGPQAMGHAEGRSIPFSTAGNRTRVIGMTSGKGGVGKSSCSVNLAVSLARKGYDVALVDADVYGYSIPKMLGIDQRPTQIDDVVMPPIAHGVKVMSVGMLVEDDDTPVMWRGPMLHKLLEQFLVDVYWGEPDFLLFDMPPGTGDVALSMANYLPRAEVLVVTTPQPAAQRVAVRSATMATKVNMPVIGVVENMSWFTGDDGKRYELFGEGGGAELATKLDVPLLAQIPFVPDIRQGGDIGLPITVTDPEGEAATAFAALADRVVELGPKRRYNPALTISG